MKISTTSLHGVVICQPAIYQDNRGFFLESWNLREFGHAVDAGISFVQDNRSHSLQDVLRGLHYQIDPWAQGKLVSVSRGRIYDVCVDLRQSSPSFGRSFGCYLDAAEGTEIWIPPGLAHGLRADDLLLLWFVASAALWPHGLMLAGNLSGQSLHGQHAIQRREFIGGGVNFQGMHFLAPI